MTSVITIPSGPENGAEYGVSVTPAENDGCIAGREAARRVIASLDKTNLAERESAFATAIKAASVRRDRQRRRLRDTVARRNRKIDFEFNYRHDAAWAEFMGKKA